jgi:hypothetical protein
MVFQMNSYIWVVCEALHWVPIYTNAHAHPCPWILGRHGCDVIVHGWAWVGMGAILLFMDGHGWASVSCIQLQIGVKSLGCREYANQEVL